MQEYYMCMYSILRQFESELEEVWGAHTCSCSSSHMYCMNGVCVWHWCCHLLPQYFIQIQTLNKIDIDLQRAAASHICSFYSLFFLLLRDINIQDKLLPSLMLCIFDALQWNCVRFHVYVLFRQTVRFSHVNSCQPISSSYFRKYILNIQAQTHTHYNQIMFCFSSSAARFFASNHNILFFICENEIFCFACCCVALSCFPFFNMCVVYYVYFTFTSSSWCLFSPAHSLGIFFICLRASC